MSAESLADAIRHVLADPMNEYRPVPGWAGVRLRVALSEHERTDMSSETYSGEAS